MFLPFHFPQNISTELIKKYSQNMFECDFMFIAEEVKTINFMITTLQPHLPKYLRKIADNNVIMILLI